MKVLARVVVKESKKAYWGQTESIPLYLVPLKNDQYASCEIFVGGVPCDFSNVKYVPWLQKVGKHSSNVGLSVLKNPTCPPK